MWLGSTDFIFTKIYNSYGTFTLVRILIWIQNSERKLLLTAFTLARFNVPKFGRMKTSTANLSPNFGSGLGFGQV